MEENLKEGSCLFGHKWTKWEEKQADMVEISTQKEFKSLFHVRKCVKCGKIQRVHVNLNT